MNTVITKTPDVAEKVRPANVAVTPLAGRLPRLRESVRAIVPYAAYGAQRLGRTGIVGVAFCIFSLIAFITGNAQLHRQLASQSTELAEARAAPAGRDAVPRPRSPQQQATVFVRSLPTRNDIPDVLASLVAAAAASGIELESGSYEFARADGGAIARYRVSVPVKGSYAQIRAFIENALATVPVVSLDSLRVERGNVAEQVIEADLRFSILLGDGT